MGPHHLGRYRPGPLDSQAGNASGWAPVRALTFSSLSGQP